MLLIIKLRKALKTTFIKKLVKKMNDLLVNSKDFLTLILVKFRMNIAERQDLAKKLKEAIKQLLIEFQIHSDDKYSSKMSN